jgi:hypothetical protein
MMCKVWDAKIEKLQRVWLRPEDKYHAFVHFASSRTLAVCFDLYDRSFSFGFLAVRCDFQNVFSATVSPISVTFTHVPLLLFLGGNV